MSKTLFYESSILHNVDSFYFIICKEKGRYVRATLIKDWGNYSSIA